MSGNIKYLFKYSLKSVFRNIRISIISILGMCLAFIVSIFILIYVSAQMNVDKSQGNYDKIYRMEKSNGALMAGGIIPWVAEKFPEVESYTRIGGTYWESMVDYQGEYHTVERVLFIDGQPFEVFDYNFIYGSSESALNVPNSVILTDRLAERIFGGENPLGKLINYNNDYPLLVTAVIEERDDIHLRFDMLVKFGMLKDIWYNGNDQFMTRLSGTQNYMGYYVLSTNNPDALTDKINSKLVETGIYNSDDNPANYWLRPFRDIYFFNDAATEQGVVHGNFQTVIAMIFVALFIILIATINYINVTTARSIARAREVGLKKLLGSSRSNLMLQFIYESTFISLIAALLAMLFIIILYIPFQTFIGIQLPDLRSLPVIIYLITMSVIILVSVAGGLYPAIYLSSLKPRNLFSTDLKSGGKGIFVRRVLLLVQFAIAIFLTIQSVAIFRQYLFMTNMDLGMDKDNIIQFEIPDYLSERSDAIREAFKEHPDIYEASFALQPLGNIRNTWTLTSPKNNAAVPIKFQMIDPEYFDVLGIELLSGRKFARDREADRPASWIINETAARAMGYEPPESITGLKWNAYGENVFEIIGVVRDYHFNAVNKPIEPSILRWGEGYKMVQLRFESDDIQGVIKHIEDTWRQFEPERPLNYVFLNENFDSQYNTEQRLGKLITLFTLIAVIIGCFGVFGISSFMSKQMSKNLMLSRVAGADTGYLVRKFSAEYLWLICIAGAVSLPLAYLYTGKWLSQFPYQADIGCWTLVLGFILNLLVALCTVAYHAFKTARLNPAEVLRYE
jgi:putative ABC transport system permease protein